MADLPELRETYLVTLECRGVLHAPGDRFFLDGNTFDSTVRLAPNHDASGTLWAVTRLSDFRVFEFRCMGAHQGNRYLDGRTLSNSVGLAPTLGVPTTGVRWKAREESDGTVTLECMGDLGDRNRKYFLNGRTLESRVDLAPSTGPDFSGTRWFVRKHGEIVVMENLGEIPGDRFLNGNTISGALNLVPFPGDPYSGAFWLIRDAGQGRVNLKCLGLTDGARFVNGKTQSGAVELVPDPGGLSGTFWRPERVQDPHSDVEPGRIMQFECLGDIPSDLPDRKYLDGDTRKGHGTVQLAPKSLSGTKWRALPASVFWQPCPFIHENKAQHPTVDVIKTIRIGQLTGSKDPQGWRLVNGDTTVWGVPGVDLGATTEHRGGAGAARLFIFFGDVVRGQRTDGPPHDADLVAWTSDSVVENHTDVDENSPGRGGGIKLHPVMGPQYFDPIDVKAPLPDFVEGPPAIGVTETYETPSGAFSFNDKVYVFVGVQDRGPGRALPGCYLISKSKPLEAGQFKQVAHFSKPGGYHGSVAPVRVVNAEHRWLPPTEHRDGLVMFAIGASNQAGGYSAINLSWMPLKEGSDPKPSDVLFFSRNASGGHSWRSEPTDPEAIFGKETNLIHLSAAYIKGLDRWLVVRQSSNPTNNSQGPIIARIGMPPLGWWEPFNLFDPCRDRAYGRYMNWPGVAPPIPWLPLPGLELLHQPGAGYGAFLLQRYTRWNDATLELDVSYLLSTGSPYQVQLMRTTLAVGPTIPAWPNRESVEQGDLALPSATALELSVHYQIFQNEPGFSHGDVVSISPPAGTRVKFGSTVTVTINLEG